MNEDEVIETPFVDRVSFHVNGGHGATEVVVRVEHARLLERQLIKLQRRIDNLELYLYDEGDE